MIRSHACWFPGLFLVNDFTVPGAAIKQGRRQEPCSTRNHLPAIGKRLRFPAAVLLRSAIQKRYTAKVVLRLLGRTRRRVNCFENRSAWRGDRGLINLADRPG